MPDNINAIIIAGVLAACLLGLLFWYEKKGKLQKTANTGSVKAVLITILSTLAAVVFFFLKSKAREEAIKKRKEDVKAIDIEAKKATDEMDNADNKIKDATEKAKKNIIDEKKADEKKTTAKISDDVDDLLDS